MKRCGPPICGRQFAVRRVFLFEGLDRVGEGGRVANSLFTRGLCHLTGDGKNKTKQMDKNCKLCLSGFLSVIYPVT